jgi:hypothetical protein
MKINRHDQAKILTAAELTQLFELGLICDRDRALFAICLYTACRINEACSLYTADVYSSRGDVRDWITFRRESTKGKQATRSIPMSPASIVFFFPVGMAEGISTPAQPMPFCVRLFSSLALRGHPPTASAARPLPRCTMPECRSNIFSRFQAIKHWQHCRHILR